ncbi:MAG: DoxX family protein [Gemmatimonadaceae bacterium]|nr:DoxX family protein [Gemmatimonadaceae bacterium]
MPIVANSAGDALSAGLLVVRLILGLGIAAHGAQKVFGWFGGKGIAGMGAILEGLGFRPGAFFAALSGAGELAGGLLVALGFLGPVGPAIIAAVMVVAIATVHWKNGFFATDGGYETALMYLVGASAIAFAGPGGYSLDAWLGLASLSAAPKVWIALALGIVAGFGALAARRSGAPVTSGAAGATR